MKNQQADPENLLGCDIANERKVGIGKSIWDFVRIIGLVAVLGYMIVILAVWMRFDSFTAGEPNLVIKYTEWILGGLGIVALFEIVFKQLATVPKRYYKSFGLFALILTIVITVPSIRVDAAPIISISNIVQASNITGSFSSSTTLHEMSVILIPYNVNGSFRINYSLDKSVGAYTIHGQIFKNGIAYGAYQSYGGATGTTISEEFTDILNQTDNISIWGNVSSGGGNLVTINSFYLLYSYNAPGLITPENQSIQTKTYPPFTADINFSWTSNLSNSQILVAKDNNFNLISIDTTTSKNYLVTALEANNYWWKVRYYNSTTSSYYSWSNVSNFTLSSTSGTTGTAIQGTVFEALNGIITPISGATVTLYNNSLSSTQTQITGSNGYYLFTGLSNSTTYNIKASRQDIYTDSQTYYLTTGLGTTLTQDIQLQRCVSGFNCFYNQHYVKFVLQNWYGITKYSGVATTVYKGSDVAPMTVQCTQLNCVTGTDGAVDILLVKDQQYRITFINAAQGISQTFTVTPFEERYYIIVSTSTGNNWWGTNITYSEVGSIIVSVSTSSTTTTGWVNVTYQDNLAQTTGLIFYLNQTNKTLATSPQIVIQSYNAGAVSNYTQNFSISSYAGNSYIVNVEAKHTTFGNVVRSFGVHFEGLKSTAADFIPSSLKAILAMGFMIFIGAIFGESRRAQGAGIMVVLGWIFLGAGFFAYFGSARIGAGLVMATIVVVMWHFNERRSAEGMQ